MTTHNFHSFWRRSALPVMVLLMFLVGDVAGLDIPDQRLHGHCIAELESQSSVDKTRQFTLGWHHQKMARLYTSLAKSAASLTIGQAKCYAEDSLVDWGAEYFGALALLELGKPDEAIEFRMAEYRKKTAPRPLLKLTRVLLTAAAVQQEKSAQLGWNSFLPRTYWDSLEAGYQAIREKNSRFSVVLPIDFDRAVVSGVNATPLLLRMQVAQLIAEDKRDDLRILMRRWEESSPPVWTIAAPDRPDTAEFVDPALPRLMAEAHLMLAEKDFAQALEESPDGKRTKWVLDRWLEVCYDRGNHQQADLLLQRAAPDELLVYRGWVAWEKGDTTSAFANWQSCLETPDYQLTTQLLHVWAGIPRLRGRASSLVVALLSDLGDLKSRAKMRKSADGRKKLKAVYRNIGAWYFARGVFDSASVYYERSRVTQEPIWLDLYSLDHCAEYFAARTFSGRIDLRQGAFARWMEMREYFPNTRFATLPLKEVIFCETREHRE